MDYQDSIYNVLKLETLERIEQTKECSEFTWFVKKSYIHGPSLNFTIDFANYKSGVSQISQSYKLMFQINKTRKTSKKIYKKVFFSQKSSLNLQKTLKDTEESFL